MNFNHSPHCNSELRPGGQKDSSRPFWQFLALDSGNSLSNLGSTPCAAVFAKGILWPQGYCAMMATALEDGEQKKTHFNPRPSSNITVSTSTCFCLVPGLRSLFWVCHRKWEDPDLCDSLGLLWRPIPSVGSLGISDPVAACTSVAAPPGPYLTHLQGPTGSC